MLPYNSLSDLELAELLNQADELAYAEIYDRYWAVLYHYSRRILQNETEAEDVVQDIFVMLWTKCKCLEIKVSLSAYLYAAVRNKILNNIRKDKVRTSYLNSLEEYIVEGKCITDHLIRENQLALRIEAEVANLPTKMREIFELRNQSQLTYKQISEKLKISELTVKKQLNNASKALKIKLTDFLSLLV